MRNYSLSCRSGEDFYRVSIKRETSAASPNGAISNFFHDKMDAGSTVMVSAEPIYSCGRSLPLAEKKTSAFRE